MTAVWPWMERSRSEQLVADGAAVWRERIERWKVEMVCVHVDTTYKGGAVGKDWREKRRGRELPLWMDAVMNVVRGAKGRGRQMNLPRRPLKAAADTKRSTWMDFLALITLSCHLFAAGSLSAPSAPLFIKVPRLADAPHVKIIFALLLGIQRGFSPAESTTVPLSLSLLLPLAATWRRPFMIAGDDLWVSGLQHRRTTLHTVRYLFILARRIW